MSTIITRQQWGARKPSTPFTPVPISARSATCVHHDGSVPINVRTVAEAYTLVRRDEAYHIDHNGWAGIGYGHLVMSAPNTEVDGLIFEGRGRDVVGAHCLNHNREWLGIQVAIGGDQQPSPAALTSVRQLHDSFVVAAGHGLAIKGHKDGFNTECPGTILYAWVRAGAPVASSPRTSSTAPSRDHVRVPVVGKPAARVLLTVDGALGPATRKRLQQWAGVTQDGDLGRQSIGAIQRKVGASVDGVMGPATIRAMQRLLRVSQDGLLGPGTVAALQTYLNKV